MLTETQKGAAGEELLAACVTLSSDGELELYTPLNAKGLAVARMYFSGAPYLAT